MQKQIKFFLMLLTVIILFTSCSNNTTKPDIIIPFSDLARTWYDTTHTPSRYKYDGKTFWAGAKRGDDDFGSIAYVIEIVEIMSSSPDSGVIIGKYIKKGAYQPDSVIGKYYGVAFKNLSDKSVEISGAANGLGFETLEEAKREYAGTKYFGVFGTMKPISELN